jgi:hypothetical protein
LVAAKSFGGEAVKKPTVRVAHGALREKELGSLMVMGEWLYSLIVKMEFKCKFHICVTQCCHEIG